MAGSSREQGLAEEGWVLGSGQGTQTCLKQHFKASGSGIIFSPPLKVLEKHSNLHIKHLSSFVFIGSTKFNVNFFANNSL